MIDLGRNLNVEISIDKTIWKTVRDHPLSQKHDLKSLDIFLMAMALGFKKKKKIPLKKGTGQGGDIRPSGENDTKKIKAIGLILSIAVADSGDLKILESKKPSDIRRIAEEYANGGIHDLYKIFTKSQSNTAITTELLSLME